MIALIIVIAAVAACVCSLAAYLIGLADSSREQVRLRDRVDALEAEVERKRADAIRWRKRAERRGWRWGR